MSKPTKNVQRLREQLERRTYERDELWKRLLDLHQLGYAADEYIAGRITRKQFREAVKEYWKKNP